MPRGCKYCPTCGASNGPRRLTCTDCQTSFPIKEKSTEPKKRGRKKSAPPESAQQIQPVGGLEYLRNPEGVSLPYPLPHPLHDEEIKKWTTLMYNHRITVGNETVRFGDKALKYFVLKEYGQDVNKEYFLKVMWETLAVLHLSQFGKYTKEEKKHLIETMKM